MTELPALLQQGAAHAWLYIPSAIALGALHGLEPGHSKTMMAAFIVAVRGTVAQAVLLGLSATLSHTAVVWAVALAGLYFGQGDQAQANEPYFQLASAAMMIGIALWMVWRTWRQQHACIHDHDDHDDHAHDAHAQAHVREIKARFANQEATTGQIVAFGLTGGLIPCPASITVLLVCLQLKQVALGAALVLSFSVGLALTMVASGVLAAMSVKHVAGRWAGFGRLADKAPYLSGLLILLVGGYIGFEGWLALR